MSALPRTYPPREPTFDSNYAEAASRYYDRFNGAPEWGSYEEKPCLAVSPSMAYSTTGFVGMDGSRGAMSASQPPPAYSESLQQLTYTPTSPYHRSNDQSSWRADVGSLGGLPERPGGPYSTKGQRHASEGYDTPASTWEGYDQRATMLNGINGGAYPPDAISRGRAGSTVAQSDSAYFQDGFGSSYEAARGIAEPQGPSAGEGRRRDRSKLPSGGAAPSYWSNPSSFGRAGNPAARDVVQPGSRLDGPTAEPAPLYSTIANALTPVSPDHVYAQPRSPYPKMEVASPTLSYSTPLPAAGAPDESQAQRYPIGQPSASTGPRSAIESVATTASPPPANPQDKKGPSGRPQKMHQCPVCQKWFPRPGGLQTHMNSHNNVKPYVCGFHECNLRFTVQSNARRHRRNAHGNEFAQQYEEAERRQPPKQPNITFDDPVVNSQIFLEAPRQLMWLPPNELEEEMTGIVS